MVQNGQPGGAGAEPGNHAKVRVLLQLERRGLAFNGSPKGMEGARSRIAGPGENQLPGTAGGDHLIVDQIRREAAERQSSTSLPNDFVAGCKTDEVGEAFDDDGVAIMNMRGNGVAHGDHLKGCSSELGQDVIDHAHRRVHVLLVDDQWRCQT